MTRSLLPLFVALTVTTADVDLGDVTLGGTGVLRLRFSGCDTVIQSDIRVRIHNAEGVEVAGVGEWPVHPRGLRLFAGDYIVRYRDADLGIREVDTQVVTDEVRTVELPLVASRLCELRFPFELPAGTPSIQFKLLLSGQPPLELTDWQVEVE